MNVEIDFFNKLIQESSNIDNLLSVSLNDIDDVIYRDLDSRVSNSSINENLYDIKSDIKKLKENTSEINSQNQFSYNVWMDNINEIPPGINMLTDSDGVPWILKNYKLEDANTTTKEEEPIDLNNFFDLNAEDTNDVIKYSNDILDDLNNKISKLENDYIVLNYPFLINFFMSKGYSNFIYEPVEDGTGNEVQLKLWQINIIQPYILNYKDSLISQTTENYQKENIINLMIQEGFIKREDLLNKTVEEQISFSVLKLEEILVALNIPLSILSGLKKDRDNIQNGLYQLRISSLLKPFENDHNTSEYNDFYSKNNWVENKIPISNLSALKNSFPPELKNIENLDFLSIEEAKNILNNLLSSHGNNMLVSSAINYLQNMIYMTEDQRKLYNYYKETNNYKKANDYAFALSDQRNQMIGMENYSIYAASMLDSNKSGFEKIIETGFDGFWDSASKQFENFGNILFADGIKSELDYEIYFKSIFLTLNYSEEIIEHFNIKLETGEISKEEYDKNIKLLNDVNNMDQLSSPQFRQIFLKGANSWGSNLGNVVPSMIIGAITQNPFLASLYMGVSAGGGALEDSFQTYGQLSAKQYAHSGLILLLTGFSQYLMGGLSGVSKNAKLIKPNNFKELAMWLHKNAIAEVGQELVEMGGELLLDDIIYNEEISPEQLLNMSFETIVTTYAMTLFLNGSNLSMNYIVNASTEIGLAFKSKDEKLISETLKKYKLPDINLRKEGQINLVTPLGIVSDGNWYDFITNNSTKRNHVSFFEMFNNGKETFGSNQLISRAIRAKITEQAKTVLDINNIYDFIEKKLGKESADTLIQLIEENSTINKFGRDVLFEYISKTFPTNEAIKIIGEVVEYVETPQYKDMVLLLKNKGINENDAFDLIYSSKGLCTYSTLSDIIFLSFKDNPLEFKKKFGFEMFRVVDEKLELNESLLLVDIYSSINDSSYFPTSMEDGSIKYWSQTNGYITEPDSIIVTNSDGSKSVDTSRTKIHLGDGITSNNSELYINKYLESKGLFITKENLYKNSLNIISSINESNEYYSLSISSNSHVINFYDSEGNIDISTNNWGEGNGHLVSILGTTEDSLIVNSWGKKLFIKFSELKFTAEVTFLENKETGKVELVHDPANANIVKVTMGGLDGK